MPRPLRPMLPFYEAALILFSAGASPAVVIRKFSGAVSDGTIYRWYYQWAELKGIDPKSQLERRGGRSPRRAEYESELAKLRKESRKKLKQAQAGTAGIYDAADANPLADYSG